MGRGIRERVLRAVGRSIAQRRSWHRVGGRGLGPRQEEGEISSKDPEEKRDLVYLKNRRKASVVRIQ